MSLGHQLFPPIIDNRYAGRTAALWIFALLLLMKGIMSVNSIVNGRNVASDADGVPLDRFPPAAAQTIVGMFGIAGIAHLMMVLAGVLALLRYRSVVPLMFALLIVEHMSRRVFLLFVPITRIGNPPAVWVNLWLAGTMIAGLILSLWRKREP